MRLIAVVGAGAAVAALLLSGCSAGSTGTDTNASVSIGAAPMEAPPFDAGTTDVMIAEEMPVDAMAVDAMPEIAMSDASGSDMRSDRSGGTIVEDRKVVQTASMSVRVDDVAAALAPVRAAVTGADGFISDSRTEDFYGGTQRAFLTARVPAERLDEVMAEIGEMGHVETSDTSTMDVSGQSVDLAAQIEAAETSVARLQELMASSGSLDDLMRVEQELTYRQATLDSLRGQKAALDGRVAMSTLTIDLSPTEAATPPKDPADEPIGFVAAFSDGWDAFVDWMAVKTTEAGYAAPFLLALLLPVGVVVAVIWAVIARSVRRKRRLSRSAPPAHDPST